MARLMGLSGVYPRVFVPLFILPLLIGGTLQPHLASASARRAQVAYLKVQQSSKCSWRMANSAIAIIVNGKTIGTTRPGDTKVMQFNIATDGQNSIELRPELTIGDPENTPFKSRRIAFAAPPGSTTDVYFSCDTEKIRNSPMKISGLWSKAFLHDYTLEPIITLEADQPKVVRKRVDTKVYYGEVIKESPIQAIAFGVDKSFSDSVTVEHSVYVSSSWHIDGSARAEIWPAIAHLEAEIRAGMAGAKQERNARAETKTSTLVLHGVSRPYSKYIVRWLKCYRVIVETVSVKGRLVDIPFRYEEEPDMVASAIN